MFFAAIVVYLAFLVLIGWLLCEFLTIFLKILTFCGISGFNSFL